MVEGQPSRPANIENIVAINQGHRPLSVAVPEAPSFEPKEAVRLLKENPSWRILDTRDSAAFGKGYIPGAINVQLSSPEFEQRIGWVFGAETPILLLTARNSDVHLALSKMAFLGLDQRVKGSIAGGMKAWLSEKLPHLKVLQVSVKELHENIRKNGAGAWRVVDVRDEEEWDEDHIESASHMNFKEMGPAASKFPVIQTDPLALICASGMRSSTAASLLRLHGFGDIRNVTGGMIAWREAGYEVTS